MRPQTSDNGPINNCPKAIPKRKIVTEFSIRTMGTLKYCAITGKAGRYISMDIEPIAVRMPNVSIINRVYLAVVFGAMGWFTKIIKKNENSNQIVLLKIYFTNSSLL